MKRLTAISLLCILLFNLYGYRIATAYLQNRADAALEIKLDEQNYSDEDLLRIKLPAGLPYYTNNKDFERVNGEVEIEGVLYKYVKRRIYNDSLELLCIPHKAKMEMQTAAMDFFKNVNGTAAPVKSEKNTSVQFKIHLPEFCNELSAFALNKIVLKNATLPVVRSVPLRHSFAAVHERPPETNRV